LLLLFSLFSVIYFVLIVFTLGSVHEILYLFMSTDDDVSVICWFLSFCLSLNWTRERDVKNSGTVRIGTSQFDDQEE